MKRLSLRQSLALWTLVPMVAFSLIVLALSSAWAWREVLDVASNHNADLARVAVRSLGERPESQDPDTLCAQLGDLASLTQRELYGVDAEGRVVCTAPGAQWAIGDRLPYQSGMGTPQARANTPRLAGSEPIVSSVPIPSTPWRLVLAEDRAHLAAPTYSLLIAISALLIVGLFISFWLLLVGFNRISQPLLAVTEQAKRVAAGKEFAPPDVDGPAEVESLVAAFNHMVTLLRRQRDTLHQYAARVLNSQEEERKRISRDLHDETAQELVGLMQRIDLCRLTAEDNPKLLAALDELSELADVTLAGIRRLSRAMRPLILEDLGLMAAVQAIADELEQQLPGGSVFCEVIGEEQRLYPEVELAAFRVVQETLNNIRKHASAADRVYITIQFKPEVLHITVEDNGPGFYLPEREPQQDGNHLGLIGMKERAELLGGRLSIITRPGEGTQVLLDLPSTPLPVQAGQA